MKITRKLLRISAAVVTGLSLTTGVAAAHSGTINQTGAGSDNDVRGTTTINRRVDNNNNLRAENNNPQSARSGEVTAYRNTTTGDVTSGSAMNDSLLRVNATVSNSGSGSEDAANMGGSNSGAISNTGASSSNTVRWDYTSNSTVRNNNNINVQNNNSQSAQSGSVNVKENTTSGSASSGDASNVSTNEIMLNVSN